MQLSIGRLAFFFFSLLLLAGVPALAAPTSTINSTVRALGMGDAYTAVANDESSFFYNPAGLARVAGINLKIFSVGAGASGVTAYEKIKGLQSGSSSGFADAIGDLYGEHVSAGFGGDSIFTAPMIGFGTYTHTSAMIMVDNPVYPGLRTSIINDYGYMMGVGVPIGFFHLGMDLKYIKRMGADKTFGPSELADLDPDLLVRDLTKWGVGYGADLGASFVIPAPFFTFAMSAAWKNVGRTSFRSNNLDEIPPEDNDVTLGLAAIVDLPLLTITPAIDFRYLNRADLQLMRKVNFGIEIGLPVLDIRGGFREGYYTAGVGVNLGLFRIDAATYGVELGDYPGQIEDRRYVAEFTMQIGLGNFTATGGGASGAAGGKNGSGSSGSSSVWGGRRLKQRR